MTARPYYINGPVTDGALSVTGLSLDYASAQVHVDFFDGAGAIVTPTAGIVDVEASFDGVNYRRIINGIYNAADVYRNTRIPPVYNGPARAFRVTMAGIVGAVTYRATVMRSVADLATNIPLTSGDRTIGRLPVDVGSTGFYAGREFRFFYEFDIPSGESRWVKATIPSCNLRLQTIEVDSGALRYRAWRGATDVGPWVAPASPTSGVFNRNPIDAAIHNYTLQSVIEIGGNGAATTVGATVSEIARVRTSGATGQRTTVGENISMERGVLEGTYYLQLENIDTGAAVGVYSFVLEERSFVE